MKHRSAIFLFFSLISLLLGGCALEPNRVEMLASPTSAMTALPPNHGLVVLQVADASPFIAYRLNQVTFAPKNVNVDRSLTFPRATALDDLGASSSTYVVALPAGSYSIESLRSYHQFNLGQAYYSKFVPVDITLGTFTVKPGLVSNLGTVVFYARPDGDGDRHQLRLVRNPSLDAKSLVTARYPGLAGQLANLAEPLGWDEDGLDTERRIAYASVVQAAMAFNAVVRLDGGRLALPGRLGSILFRNGDGDWSIDAIDSDVDVLGYAPTGDGDALIATEFRQLCLKRQGQPGCDALQLPDAPGAIANIALAANGKLYLVLRQKNQLAVFVSESVEAPAWRRLADAVPQTNLLMLEPAPAEINLWRFFNADDAMYMVVAGSRVNETLFRLDYGHDRLEPIKYPTLFAIGGPLGSYLTVSYQNGRLYAMNDAKGNALYRLGPTGEWEELDGETSTRRSLGFRAIPHFWTAERGFGISKINDFDYGVLATEDGGDHWTQVAGAKLPKNCTELIPEIGPGKLLLYCRASGRFYRSEDSGASWLEDRFLQIE